MFFKNITTFILNLPHRKDRFEKIKLEYEKLKFDKIPYIINGVYPEELNIPEEKLLENINILNRFTKGAFAYNQSMFNLFDKAEKEKLEYILVLEDDTEILENCKNNLEKIINELPDDWDILLLSSYHYNPPIMINKDIYIATGIWSLPMTLYNKTSFNKCKKLTKEFRPFDLSLGMIKFLNHGLKIYASKYNLAKEYLSESDISIIQKKIIPIDITTHEKIIPIELLTNKI